MEEKVNILAIGVHPDDIELGCSGALLQHIRKGYQVGLLDLTRGELGSRGSATIRTHEAMKAAELLGAKFRIQLSMLDGFFEHNPANLTSIIEIIRYAQPDIVLANAFSDRHPDHGRAGKLIADACFLAGLIKIKTDYKGNLQTAWRPKNVYHYIQDYYLKPDFIVDISDVMSQKLELIQTYRSQFYNPKSKEPETPISGQDFLDFVQARAKDMGRPAGYAFAEGFQTAKSIGVKDLFHLD